MPREPHPRDPWRNAPVGELQEQLLPRWFVLTALVSVPVVLAVVAVVLFAFDRDDRIPVAARRPPPAGALTNAVGEWRTGDAAPQAWEDACPLLEGVHIAGAPADLAVLDTGLEALCALDLPGAVAADLRALASGAAVVRFAQFEATGVDSTVVTGGRAPLVLVNRKFGETDPFWVAPLLAHDATLLRAGPGTAEGALAARRAEREVCDRLFSRERRESRGCADAAAILALPDPLAALREAGYR